MKKNFICALLLTIILVVSCGFTNKELKNSDKDKLLMEIITYVLDKLHYSPKDLEDDFSAYVFVSFIEKIDPMKQFFLKSDIKEFDKYRYAIDEQIKNTEIDFFSLVYTRFLTRAKEAEEICEEILANPFDFHKKEKMNTDYEKQPYSRSRKKLKDKWRVHLKHDAIELYTKKLKDTLQKEDISEAAIEIEAREKIKSNVELFFDNLQDLDAEDYFKEYINSIVESFDPHTLYLAPRDKDVFDRNMSGKFEGIGAQLNLNKKKNEIKITDIIPGGPVWKGNLLEVGDQILKVAQENEEPVDVFGKKLDDVIVLIKGPKGTKVFLTIKKNDGTIKIVPIVRGVVELEESFAKSTVVKKGEKTFGLINLPKFYVDFKDYNNRNAASDVRKEIKRLKKAGIEGLVIDLRGNGGGSLKTVVEMAGLFIKKGPIVQVKSTGDKKEVFRDLDNKIYWDGPLVILVNKLSASASEILAAAMQDYKRAIVLGSKQTFGKGTVQNIIGLDNIVRNSEHKDLGALKLTTQKFYRINGGSTQLEGVKSDVIVPSEYDYIDEIGEKGWDKPLPWDKIGAVYYDVWERGAFYDKVAAKSRERMYKNPQILLIDEKAKWIKQQRNITEFPLHIEEYERREAEREKKIDYFKKIDDFATNLSFKSLPYEMALMKKDTILKENRKRWHKNLSKDVYIDEALNVLLDLQHEKSQIANVGKD